MNDVKQYIEQIINHLMELLPLDLIISWPPSMALLGHANGRYIIAGMMIVAGLIALWILLWVILMLLGGKANPAEAHPKSSPHIKVPEVMPKNDEILANDNGFRFFKRGSTVKVNEDDAALAAIEQEMLALRQLFNDGHLLKDVYIAETRRLFDKAKLLRV